jgi:hypothetical protein
MFQNNLSDKNLLRGKKGQQEMVGFILIVVLVMIGLMVFLVISLRTSPEKADSLEVNNMLSAIMSHTTECAIPAVPDYETFEDLFKDCYGGDDCAGTVGSTCDYLNETLQAILEDMMASEGTVDAYQLDFSVKSDEGQEGLLRIFEGNCTGEVTKAQRRIDAGSEDLIIQLKVCKGDN